MGFRGLYPFLRFVGAHHQLDDTKEFIAWKKVVVDFSVLMHWLLLIIAEDLIEGHTKRAHRKLKSELTKFVKLFIQAGASVLYGEDLIFLLIR